MTTRQAVARHQGLNEDTIAKVERYESSDLPDNHKVALQLTDALMTQPGQIDEALQARLRRHFTDEQILEITLYVMKFNVQKVMVALGTDDEVRPGELAEFDFDESGRIVVYPAS